MRYLKKWEIITINKMTIDRHSGSFTPPANIKNEESFEYLIDAASAKMFGQPIYSSISDKAGFYMYSIITRHVFWDGAKRTGLESALLFLAYNGFELIDKLQKVNVNGKTVPEEGKTSNEILTNFALEVASSKLKEDEVQYWFEKNITKV